MTIDTYRVPPPSFSTAAQESARQYLANRKVTPPESTDLHRQLKEVAEHPAAMELVRSSRERYYEILAYAAATYLWIDGHEDREALFQACAVDVGFRRFQCESSYVSCVLLRIIAYGSAENRGSQRQFWNRDANAVLRLLRQGATPADIPQRLKAGGGVKVLSRPPGSAPTVKTVRQKTAGAGIARRKQVRVKNDEQFVQLLNDAHHGTLIATIFAKDANGRLSYKKGLRLGPLQYRDIIFAWFKLEAVAKKIARDKKPPTAT